NRMSLRPSESFTRIIGVVRFVAACLGIDTYNENYRVNKNTAMTVSAIIIYSGFTISTVIRERSWMFTLQALVLAAFVIQSVNKLYVGIRWSKKIYVMNHSVRMVYEEFEKHEDPRYSRDLMQNCKRLRRGLIIAGIMYAVGVAGMIILPIYVSLFTNEFLLILHFHIPFIDVTTKTGAWITQAVHAVSMTIAGLGLLAGDTTIIVHLMQPYIYVDILRLKIDAFNKFVEEPQSESEIQELLVDIMQFHQKYLKYNFRCNELCSSIVSTQVFSAGVCIVMTIFVVLTSDWISGYCFAIVLVPNLYTYCILGTLVENCVSIVQIAFKQILIEHIQNDQIMYEVYNIAFYNLNARLQREVCFMLSKTQSNDMMQVIGVMPLDVSTALQV
ncbi:hypothetical protein KR044_011513, partial [Drosophila immigrans]